MSGMIELLEEARQRRWLRPLDVQFARMLAEDDQPHLLLAAACLSAYVGAGHVCLPLSKLHPNALFDGRDRSLAQEIWQRLGKPDETEWRQRLLSDPAVGEGEEAAPLVFQQDNLYLQRSWQGESRVAQFIAGNRAETVYDEARIRAVLDALFPAVEGGEADWQKIAAAVALTRRIAVISGGPGTGKTTTVARLLAALIALQEGPSPRIQLAAPTGKAAARLTESLGSVLSQLPLSDAERLAFPQEATTLHRLLGAVPDSQRLRYHQDNPLHLDVLVVDEASMVDLPMMANLIAALPPQARIILLGDRDQLASVEAGAVLGDICRFAEQGYSQERCQQLNRLTGCTLASGSAMNASVADSICLLRKSYRFTADSGIGQLAKAVNRGDEAQLLAVLQQGYGDIACLPLADNSDYQRLLDQAVEGYTDYLQRIASGDAPEQVLQAFQRYRQLCALREGPFGVAGLNQRIERALQVAGLIQRPTLNGGRWYVGRPVMIERNDAVLGLFNGDIGISMTNEQGELRVYFQLPDGRTKSVAPSRLPPHETAYAMTVHKSQGSEFEHTALALPNHFLPVLTRELVYTAITRARKRLSLFSDRAILCRAVSTPTQRYSGLEARIRALMAE